MASSFHDSFFDGMPGMPPRCNPITQAELDDAESFDAMVDNTSVEMKALQKVDREGVARTKVEDIEGDGPVMFESEVLSMHRLLWADGAMHDSDKTTKATLAVLKINMDSYTISSGEGKDKAVQKAVIQVEFHGTGSDADTAGAQRPVLVGWAPFAMMERSNQTTADLTRDRSLSANVQGGLPQAGATLEVGGNDSRAWQQRYFDKYHSRPVAVSGRAGRSNNYNGVRWTLEQNSLAREGVKPELLLYLLVKRQDDSEYAVKITANVYTSAKLFGHREHKCVLRVTPKEPSREKPTVRYLDGEKMWPRLDVDHFEKLVSPGVNNSLVLPWDMEETAGTNDAKSGAVGSSITAGAKHGKDPEHEAEKSEGANTSNEVEGRDAAKAAPSATLTEAVHLTTKRADERVSPVPKTGRDAAPPLADKDVMNLLGLDEGEDTLDMEGDLPTRMAVLESRMEAMEYRMARQAGVIRALLKHKG